MSMRLLVSGFINSWNMSNVSGQGPMLVSGSSQKCCTLCEGACWAFRTESMHTSNINWVFRRLNTWLISNLGISAIQKVTDVKFLAINRLLVLTVKRENFFKLNTCCFCFEFFFEEKEINQTQIFFFSSNIFV